MKDYEQIVSKERKNYTVKDAAIIRSTKAVSMSNEDAAIARFKKRIDNYGNSGYFRNLGSDDRISGKVYDNVGTNDSEIKSYFAGYYINGEMRVLAKLDKSTREEAIALGEYEHDILGIQVENLNLLKKNVDYMTGYMTAMLTNSNKKHR